MSALLSCAVLLSASVAAGGGFDFLFSWGRVVDDETARAYAEIGVTDICARGRDGFAAAKRHGLVPYCSYTPVGPHKQVLREDEQRRLDFINAADLEGKASKEDIRRVCDERRIAAGFRYGGEPEGGPALCATRIACFLSDTNCVMAKATLAKTLAKNPGAEGIAFDFIGYTNMRSCECEDCKRRLAAFLAKEGLAENEENRNRFFRTSLLGYINALVDYVRGVRPGIKVTIHLYPAFVPDPVYGGDIKADTVQETVAWYFQWPDAKIADYTRRVSAGEHQPGSVRVPFVGLESTPGKSLASKTPERLEEELRIILAAGGRRLGVCNGGDMLKPGYREVFMKYCRRPGIGHR